MHIEKVTSAINALLVSQTNRLTKLIEQTYKKAFQRTSITDLTSKTISLNYNGLFKCVNIFTLCFLEDERFSHSVWITDNPHHVQFESDLRARRLIARYVVGEYEHLPCGLQQRPDHPRLYPVTGYVYARVPDWS